MNDEIITQGEIDRILIPIYQQYKNQSYADDELVLKLDNARKDILDRLIQDKLLLAEAKKLKVEVDPREIKERVDMVRNRFSSEAEFRQALASENLNLETLEKKYKDRIMIDRLIDIEVRRRVSVSPKEIWDYYNEHKAEFEKPRSAKVRSILMRTGGETSDEDAEKLANQVLGRVEEGGSFILLAREYSSGPYKESGGDMGWVEDGDLMEDLNEAVFKLEPGEISGVIKSGLGFHIFMLEEKRESRIMDFNESKNEIEELLYSSKTEEALGAWIKELKKNAYIAFR